MKPRTFHVWIFGRYEGIYIGTLRALHSAVAAAGRPIRLKLERGLSSAARCCVHILPMP